MEPSRAVRATPAHAWTPTFFWDRLFGTYYDRPERPEKSETVFNLGYTPEMADRYPHVARLSGGVATGHPRERVRDKAAAER